MGRNARVLGFLSCVAGAAAIVASGCGPAAVSRPGPETCATLDSLYAAGGFARSVSITGHATVDANQYKVRGKVRVDARAPGNAVIEFTSTVLFGHAREDLVFSSAGDTVRIVDRERGAYYEGDEAESFLARSLDTDLDVRWMLRLVLGGRPACEELSDIGFRTPSDGATVCEGTHAGREFRVVFGADCLLRSVEWPVWSRARGPDRLRATYEWVRDGSARPALRSVVLTLEKREWRCRIKSSS